MLRRIPQLFTGWTLRHPALFSFFFFISGMSMTFLFSMGGDIRVVYIPVALLIPAIVYFLLIKNRFHLRIIDGNTPAVHLLAAFVLSVIVEVTYSEITKTFIINTPFFSTYSGYLLQHGIYDSINITVLFLCLLSWFALWLFLVFLLNRFLPSFIVFLKRTDKVERWGIVLVAIASIPVVFWLYNQTNVFYEPVTNNTYFRANIIYNADTPLQFFENVWMNMSAAENDLRQPLFSPVSWPFSIISVSLSFFDAKNYAVWLCITQIVGLVAAFFLLGGLMKLGSTDKALFVLLLCATYPVMLFGINLEQYIISLFWLIIFIYLAEQKSKNSFAVALAATGAMLTNGIALLLLLKDKVYRNPKKWFHFALVFAVILLIGGKTYKILRISDTVSVIDTYTATEKTFADKFTAYTGFVTSCFIAPPHTITATSDYFAIESRLKPQPDKSAIQYQYCQEPLNHIDWYGAGILALVVIAAIVHRRNPFAQIAFGWVLFSFLLVGVAGWGWGTEENTNFLYTLLFSWAFIGLLYLLIAEWLKKCPILKYAVTAACILLLLTVNIPDFMDVIRFALRYYPI
jgi:hypothetical protein